MTQDFVDILTVETMRLRACALAVQISRQIWLMPVSLQNLAKAAESADLELRTVISITDCMEKQV